MRGGCNAADGAVYVHVDDMLFGHECLEIAELAARAVMMLLRSLGFLVGYTPGHLLEKVVGMGRSTCPAAIAPLSRRIGDIDRALWFFATSTHVCPDAVATVLGFWVWLMLLWRPGLSAATAIFPFVNENRGMDLFHLWPSVRRDCLRMRALLGFARTWLGQPTIAAGFTQDSAGGGAGEVQGRHCAYCLAFGFPSMADLAYVASRTCIRGLSSSGPQPLGDVDVDTESLLPRTVLPRTFVYGAPWSVLKRTDGSMLSTLTPSSPVPPSSGLWCSRRSDLGGAVSGLILLTTLLQQGLGGRADPDVGI